MLSVKTAKLLKIKDLEIFEFFYKYNLKIIMKNFLEMRLYKIKIKSWNKLK